MLKNINYKHITGLLLIIVTVLISCTKGYFDGNNYTSVNYKPGLAVPLINASFSLDQVVPAGLGTGIDVANDLFLTLVYASERTSPPANEMFPILDQDFSGIITLSAQDAAQLTGGSDLVKNLNSTHTLTTETEKFYSATLQSGEVKITVGSDVPNLSSVFVSLTGFTNSTGAPLSTTISVGSNGVGTGIINLAGANADFSSTSGGNFNSIDYQVEAQVAASSGAAEGQTITASLALENVKYSFVKADFGPKTIDLQPDSTRVILFNNTFGEGIFTLLEPKLTVRVSTDIANPASTEASLLLGYSAGQPNISFFAPTLSQPFNFNVPGLGSAGTLLTSSVSADQTNSTIKNVIDGRRNFLVTDFNPRLNPTGVAYQGEAKGDGKYVIRKELELPMNGLAFNFLVLDTFDFTFGYSIQLVEEALFRVATTNSFPADVRFQLYFTDENYNVLDSLLAGVDDKILEAAPTDAQGKSIGRTTKTNDIVVTEERVKNLNSVSKLLLKASVISAENGTKNIRVYSTDAMDIKVGMNLKLSPFK